MPFFSDRSVDILTIISDHVVDGTKNIDDLVVTIDLKPNQRGGFLIKGNFNISMLFVNRQVRNTYLDTLRLRGITLSLRSTSAAYDLSLNLPREMLRGIQRLVQEVPLNPDAIEDMRRVAVAGVQGKSVFSINNTDLPNLKTLLVTFIPSEEYSTFVSIHCIDMVGVTNEIIARAMLARTLKSFGAFIPSELNHLLSHRPAASCTWYPTMIINPDINLYPIGNDPSYLPIFNRDDSLPQIVLLKEATTKARVWTASRTVNINKLPGSLPTDALTSMYLRATLNPLVARGERIEVFFLLDGDLKKKAGTGRLRVYLQAKYTLGRLFGTIGIDKTLGEQLPKLKIGRLVPGPTMKEQEVKQGEEFVVTLV